MRRIPYTIGRAAVTKSIRGIGVAAMALSLAVSASAVDGKPAGKTQPGSKMKRWYQIGIASWYGRQFQGKKTATGERFDMNSMTCAHPTLPMGTWLKVTNLKNHKSTFVRVNDRGPVTEGRIVDLSFAAAHVLGLGGVGHVKLEAVHENDQDLLQAMVAQVQMPGLFGATGR